MWNFGRPYKLKQLIDLVAQRNYLFSYDGREYGPLVKIEKAIAVYTRGSRFLEDSPIPASRFDHQAPYIDFLAAPDRRGRSPQRHCGQCLEPEPTGIGGKPRAR